MRICSLSSFCTSLGQLGLCMLDLALQFFRYYCIIMMFIIINWLYPHLPLHHQFFQWLDQHSSSSNSGSASTGMGGTQTVRPKFSDPDSIMGYFRGQRLPLYCQCRFVRRAEDRRFRQGIPVSGASTVYTSVCVSFLSV